MSQRTRAGRPVGYDDLLAVARNLRWTWHAGARRMFSALGSGIGAAGETASEWPLLLLRSLGPEAVEARLRADPALATLARAVVQDWERYSSAGDTTWFRREHPAEHELSIAYFAAEFALTDSLPIYAGGLGAIAGEQLKSASALGVPLVGVGLLYRETSHQWLDEHGLQQESWEVLDPDRLPIEPARDAFGRPVVVTVPLPGRDLAVQVWSVPVGRNRLLLLDAAHVRNHPADRGLTARLYGGDQRTRIAQEMILGVGGIRALAALGVEPTVVHLNEGHSAFAIFERIRRLMARDALSFAEAREIVAASTVFTTHTPVAAGHDYFPPDLAWRHLEPLARIVGVDVGELLTLGQYRPGDPTDTFCPTVLALRLAGSRNGVSRLHGVVTREQWGGLWPRLPLREVPIGHITNGIHYQSWISDDFDELLDQQLGPSWRALPGDPATWKRLLDLGPADVWRAKCAARAELVAYARGRSSEQAARRGGDPDALANAARLLDPDALTIGFVGRFVAYKRPTLFLRDPERLARLLTDPDRPVQIVFGGKAHPNDEGGKQLLRDVAEFARRHGLEHRIVFVEDFDLTIDRMLARGADLWLNTPRRPLEACGVGGMKAGVNGALNLSTLDGWWDEAWTDADPDAPPIGWSIGTRDHFDDLAEQDEHDASSFYDMLEREVIPRFFSRDADGIPGDWVASMQQSMATLASTWHSHRMVREYTESAYLPCARRARALEQGGGARARDAAAELARLHAGWPGLRVRLADVAVDDDGTVRATIDVELGVLELGDVVVELWVAPPGRRAEAVSGTLLDGSRGRARFVAATLVAPGSEPALAARVRPHPARIGDDPRPGLITWSD